MGEVTARIVGGLQIIGGGLEVALGVGAAAVPEPLTTAGGVILIAHGGDTVVAGFRSLWHGEVAQSGTQQLAAGSARAMGASDETAGLIGTGVDFAAGLGPSMAITVSRRFAVSAATSDAPQVLVAYANSRVMGPGARVGHNMVGVSQGGDVAWFELIGKQSAKFIATKSPAAGFVITPLRITTPQAARAGGAAQGLVNAGRTSWQVCGPNCTTTATQVLREAGVVVPAWSVSPFLLSTGVRAGGEVTVLGAGVATGAAATGE